VQPYYTYIADILAHLVKGTDC